MRAVAFELREEYAGNVEQDGEQVPAYSGGVLAVDGGEFHTRDELDAGDGVIVIRESDSVLSELLSLLPPLKSTPVPEGRVPLSPYLRRNTEDLRHFAALRELTQGGSREELIQRLDAYDAANEAGDLHARQAVIDGDEAAIRALASGGTVSDGLDRLNKGDLEALATSHDVDLEDAKTNADIIERLRAAGVRREED